MITLTPPTQYININGTQTDITNLYNLSSSIKTSIDNGATNLEFQDSAINTYLQYVSLLEDTEFTIDQLGLFIIFCNIYIFNSVLYSNIYNGIITLSSPQTLNSYGMGILFGNLTLAQKTNLVKNYLTTSSLISLQVTDYIGLFTQVYFSSTQINQIFSNNNFSMSDKINIIAGAKSNSNMDSFTTLVVDENGIYYLKKTFMDVAKNSYYYYLSLTDGTKTINGLPSGVTNMSIVTTLTSSQVQTIITNTINNVENRISTVMYCLYNQGITISG